MEGMQQSWKNLIAKYDAEREISTAKIISYIDVRRFALQPHLDIFPSNAEIFKAFNFCKIKDIKVVIIGQDPYHGPSQATGLCFAVENGITIPPSLRNIIKELKNDLNIDLYDTSLKNWCNQGVLLLNAALTVVQGKPASQINLWSDFTDYIIEELNKKDNPIIFVAWGAFAHNKLKNIDINKHNIIVSSHPSPLSCYKKYKQFPEFMGSKPFTRINQLLEKTGNEKILF